MTERVQNVPFVPAYLRIIILEPLSAINHLVYQYKHLGLSTIDRYAGELGACLMRDFVNIVMNHDVILTFLSGLIFGFLGRFDLI